MENEELKTKILNGELALFKKVDMDGKILDNEILDIVGLCDLTIGNNAERMSNLTTLYDGGDCIFDNVRYSVICGYKLIATLIKETAENMFECVDETPEDEEERFNEYLTNK